MKRTRIKERLSFLDGEKRFQKLYYRVIIALVIFTVVYATVFEPLTMGGDMRYAIYIFWLPVIFGAIFLGSCRWKFLFTQFAANKGFVLWSFMIFFYALQGMLFSYISFGQVAKVCWDIASYNESKRQPVEYFNCTVTEFDRLPSAYAVYFRFEGKLEYFTVSNETIRDYLQDNPSNYFVVLEVQKGIWNYYRVRNWEIKRSVTNPLVL